MYVYVIRNANPTGIQHKMRGIKKLHHLIHSLSKTEKRYVSIELSKQRSKKGEIDLLLFNILKKQEVIDLKKISSISEFNSTLKLIIRSKYLFEYILRCLIDYYYAREIEIAIGNHIRIIKIFVLKGLHEYTQYHFKIAQKLAEKYEDLYRQGILCTLKKTIINRGSSSHAEYFREIQKIENQESIIHQKIVNLNEYNNHLNHLSVALKKNSGSRPDGETMKVMKEVASTPLFSNEKNALTKKARIVFYEVNSILQELMHHDYGRSLIYTEKQMHLIREMDSYEKTYSPAYVNCLKYCCIFASQSGQLSKAKEALKELEAIYMDRSVAGNIFQRSLIFLNHLEAETHLTLVDHDVKRFESALGRVSAEIEQFTRMFDSESLMLLNYHIAIRSMFMNEYKNAFRSLEKILHEHHGMRIDILQDAHVLSLLCIYEIDSVNLFQSRERSYLRHYQARSGENQDVHTKMIHLLAHVYQFKNNAELVRKNVKELETFTTEKMKQNEVDRLLGETVLGWVKKKI